ncbi:hypothetical protein Droror1_Dr00016569 [Drosera rotundifolia]
MKLDSDGSARQGDKEEEGVEQSAMWRRKGEGGCVTWEKDEEVVEAWWLHGREGEEEDWAREEIGLVEKQIGPKEKEWAWAVEKGNGLD